MLTASVFVFSLLSLGEWARAAQAEQVIRELEDSQLQAQRSIREFRKQVRVNLTSSERTVEESIDYSVPLTWEIYAGALRRRSGERFITMTAGHFTLLHWLAAAMASPRWGASDQCVVKYFSEAVTTLLENSRAAQIGRPLSPLFEFFEYARRHPSICGELSINEFEKDAQGQHLLRAYHGASVRFVLAHELGHHLKGMAKMDAPLADKRRHEMEADRFALSEATRTGPGAIVLAIPAYLLVAGTSCTPEEEQYSTHPSAEWRLKLMADTLREYVRSDVEFRQALPRERLKTIEEQVEAMVEILEDSLSP